MILIIGLGNPGQKFQKTRHNIGFRTIDEFASKHNLSGFQFSKKFNAETIKEAINGQKIILAKPQTFMNLSGKTAKLLIRNYKLEIRNLVVVHDDADLSLGEIRIVKNRGAAGHKGVESIIRELKTKDFIRFRMGVKSNLKLLDAYKRIPRRVTAQCLKPELKTKNLEKFVLKKFNKEEEKVVKEVIQKTVEAIETALKEGVEKAMNKYNSLTVITAAN